MRKAVFVLLLMMGSLVGYAQNSNYAILTLHQLPGSSAISFIISYGGDENEVINYTQFVEKGDNMYKTEYMAKLNIKVLELFKKIEDKGYNFFQMGAQSDVYKQYIFKKK